MNDRRLTRKTVVSRRIGLAAAVLALAMPFIPMIQSIGASDTGVIKYLRLLNGPKPIPTTVLVGISIALQLLVVVLLLTKKRGAEALGARVAQGHACFALIVGFAAIVGYGALTGDVFSTWQSVWYGEPSRFAPMPILLLIQWVCLRMCSKATTQEIWRGVSIACIAFNGLLGTFTFAMDGRVALFTSPTVTFFNIGVLCHILAIVLIYTKRNAAWLWSGIIGFTCLISGFILTNIYSRNPSETAYSLNEWSVGATLYAGWYEIATYLPIIAYAMASISAIRLYQIARAST